MKITNAVLLLALLAGNNATFAYSPEELAKDCHKPKFTDFTLTEYKAPSNVETAPEAEFSFKVSAWTSPESIKLMVKQHPVAFTVESNTSFHKVRAKIPAEFTGQFLRLNVSAKVIDGICHEETGWLLKIADKTPVTAETEKKVVAPEAENGTVTSVKQ